MHISLNKLYFGSRGVGVVAGWQGRARFIKIIFLAVRDKGGRVTHPKSTFLPTPKIFLVLIVTLMAEVGVLCVLLVVVMGMILWTSCMLKGFSLGRLSL